MAQIFLKQEKWDKCMKSTDKLLDVDDKNVKCMYRRAQACCELNNFEEAERMCLKIKELDPTSVQDSDKL